MKLLVICGPPCAGKTTLAHHIAGPRDQVLDFDDIARALGSPVQWIHPQPWRAEAEREMRRRMNEALEQPSSHTTIVIRGAPLPQQRARLARDYGPTYLLNPGMTTCLARAQAERTPQTINSITKWFRWYRPWKDDRSALLLAPAQVSESIRDL